MTNLQASRERLVGGEVHAAKVARGEHGGDVGRAAQALEHLLVAGVGDARQLERLLVHRRRDHRVGVAGEALRAACSIQACAARADSTETTPTGIAAGRRGSGFEDWRM